MKRKMTALLGDGLVHLVRNREFPSIYDVEMGRIKELGRPDSLEVHAVLYPFDRRVNAKHFAFLPFEEYVRDIASSHRSLYSPIETVANNLFGAALGLAIAAVFAVFNPKDLVSVQSVVSVFGAYFIGKDLWDDVERALVGISKRWRLRFVTDYYAYGLERRTTLANYSAFAKETRYGKVSALPEKMAFIQESNSQTLRLYFAGKDLDGLKEDRVHLFSIHVDPAALKEMDEGGFLFGVKVAASKHVLGVRRSLELFQSLKEGARGCLGPEGRWLSEAAFCRRTLSAGRLKLFASEGFLEGVKLVSGENGAVRKGGS
jgi:hypothetical protein